MSTDWASADNRPGRRAAAGPSYPPAGSESLCDPLSSSDLADQPGAVAELRLLNPELVQDRQVQIRERCARGRRDILAADVLAIRAAHQDLRQRIVVVLIAVAHVRAVQEQRMIEDAALTLLRIGQLLQEVREALDVVALDDLEPANALLVIGVVTDG